MPLGTSLRQGPGSLASLVVIFPSNLPEALGEAVGRRDQGRTGGLVILAWAVAALLLVASVVAAKVILLDADERLLPVFLALAGDAALASLADPRCPMPIEKAG